MNKLSFCSFEGHRRQYTNSTVIRPDGKYNPAIYDVEVDHGILTPRLFYSLKVLYRNADVKLPRALGPKEIGKTDYEVANVNGANLATSKNF